MQCSQRFNPHCDHGIKDISPNIKKPTPVYSRCTATPSLVTKCLVGQKICYGQTLIQGFEPYDIMIWNHALFTCHSRTVHLHSKPTTRMFIILERFWEFKPCDHDLENGNPTQTIPLVMCKTFAGNSNTDGLQNSTLVPGKAPHTKLGRKKYCETVSEVGQLYFRSLNSHWHTE